MNKGRKLKADRKYGRDGEEKRTREGKRGEKEMKWD